MNKNFAKELTVLINTHGVDAYVGMADFVVAEFMCRCLSALRTAVGDQLAVVENDYFGLSAFRTAVDDQFAVIGNDYLDLSAFQKTVDTQLDMFGRN